MKKLIVLLMIFTSVNEGWGVEYDVNISITNLIAKSYSSGLYCNIFPSPNTQPSFTDCVECCFQFQFLSSSSYTPSNPSCSMKSNSSNWIYSLIFWGDTQTPTTVSLNYPCMDMVQHIEWELFKFTVHIVIKPKFSVSIAQNSSNDIVLIDNRNTALNTNLSSSSSNVWEFQIGSNWYQYPENSSSISISGNSLFSTLKSQYSALGNFIDLIGYQTIRVRHKLECLPSYSNEIVLHPKLASPTVSNIVTTPPTCHGASDGKAVIRFSRAVYNKELLQFAVKGISGIAHTVPPGSDTFTLTGLSAGIDTIIISGKYPYNN